MFSSNLAKIKQYPLLTASNKTILVNSKFNAVKMHVFAIFVLNGYRKKSKNLNSKLQIPELFLIHNELSLKTFSRFCFPQ